MVIGMRIVREKSSKKEDVIYSYLEIDFGYRKAKVFDIDNLLFPEMCGMTAEQFYALGAGQSVPVKFDLPAIHNSK